MNPRPVLFIGSSAEGLDIAEAIQLNLDHECEVVIWSQGVFGLSEGTLESLVNSIESFDFAALVLTPDDLVTSREKTQQSPRDNVLLELGLFVGAIGRERTFAIYDRSANLKMPSDLAGVTKASFQRHNAGSLQSTVGAPCTQIKSQIRKLGTRSRPSRPIKILLDKPNNQVWIRPAAQTIISADEIPSISVASDVIDVIAREAEKIVNCHLVEFLIEFNNYGGGTLKMSVPILAQSVTLLEFSRTGVGSLQLEVGYPLSILEYMSGDSKTVHEVNDESSLELLLHTVFNSDGAKQKVTRHVQAAKSKEAVADRTKL
jgi:hypothetical protein